MHNYTADNLSQNFINKKYGHNHRYFLDSDQEENFRSNLIKNDFSARKLNSTQKLLFWHVRKNFPTQKFI